MSSLSFKKDTCYPCFPKLQLNVNFTALDLRALNFSTFIGKLIFYTICHFNAKLF